MMNLKRKRRKRKKNQNKKIAAKANQSSQV
jgi:hypothetical protein